MMRGVNFDKKFQEANSFQEVYALAKKLKSMEFDPAEVNAAASKRKRELRNDTNFVSPLVKVTGKASSTQNMKTSSVYFEIQDIKSARVVVMADRIIV